MECLHYCDRSICIQCNPAGTVTPVKVTCPGLVPIVGLPSKVSLANIFDVVSPVVTPTLCHRWQSMDCLPLTVTLAVSTIPGGAGVAPTFTDFFSGACLMECSHLL
jgi:hypothetical protein